MVVLGEFYCSFMPQQCFTYFIEFTFTGFWTLCHCIFRIKSQHVNGFRALLWNTECELQWAWVFPWPRRGHCVDTVEFCTPISSSSENIDCILDLSWHKAKWLVSCHNNSAHPLHYAESWIALDVWMYVFKKKNIRFIVLILILINKQQCKRWKKQKQKVGFTLWL